MTKRPHMTAVALRPEQPADAAAIAVVHRAAFAGHDEVRIVEALRTAGALSVSLVAVLDGGIVGHVAMSPVTVDERVVGVGLAPVGVLPEHQRRGIGGDLCRRALDVARSIGWRACVVLGHPAYYPRFGFVHASTNFGLQWSGGHDDAFFACELVVGALSGVRGVVHYRPEVG
jgi:putative acetyltransferase